MGISSSGAGASAARFASFREFYPYYLEQHSQPACRRLHVCGTLLALLTVVIAASTGHRAWYLAAPLAGYLPAWVGHWFFQHNLPATFRHPFYSLRADFVMLLQVVSGRVPW